MDAITIRNELITTARFRLQRLQELISLAEEQRAILLERRHADLQENLRKHDPLLIDLAKVEKREESLLGMLTVADSSAAALRSATEESESGSGRASVPASDASVAAPGSATEASASPDFEAQYAEINRETRALALTLQTLVAGNTQLLKTMMEYVEFSIGIISKLVSEQQSYDPAADTGAAALLLDRKV
jgi:hypothetical protein